MAKIKSFGVTVEVDGNAIGGLTDVSIPEVEVTDIDTTTHDTEGGYRTFVGGLKDGGTLTISGLYDIANTGQVFLRTAANQGGEPVEIVVTFSDGSTATFDTVVKGYGASNPLDENVTFTASFKISGAVTYAAAVA